MSNLLNPGLIPATMTGLQTVVNSSTPTELATFQSTVSWARNTATVGGQLTAILIGDSKTAQNGGTSTATPIQSIPYRSCRGAFNHANFALGHPITVVGNSGIAGQTSTQIRARFLTDAVAYAPSIIVERCGTNDTDASSNTVANRVAMWDMAGQAGIKVLALAIPPKANAGANLANRQYFMACNLQLRAAAAVRSWVIWCDDSVATVDPNTTFEPAAGLTDDGTHESPAGAAAEGALIAAALRQLVGARDNPWLPQSNGDTLNLLSNGMMYGTGATLPTGWANSGTATLSYVARSRTAEKWFQAAVANGSSYTLTSNASVDGTTLSVGDKLVFVAEFECDSLESAPAANTQGICVKIRYWNGSTFVATVSADMYWDATYANFQTLPTGVFQTDAISVPAGSTIAQVQIQMNGGGNYRWSRCALRNLTKSGIAIAA